MALIANDKVLAVMLSEKEYQALLEKERPQNGSWPWGAKGWQFCPQPDGRTDFFRPASGE